jgi:hypothetical protein
LLTRIPTAWFVQVGELNTVHHLWQFADLEERRNGREQSWGVSGWADTVRYFSFPFPSLSGLPLDHISFQEGSCEIERKNNGGGEENGLWLIL